MFASLLVVSLLLGADAIPRSVGASSFLQTNRAAPARRSNFKFDTSSSAFVTGLEIFRVPDTPLPAGTKLPKVVWGLETNGNAAYEAIVEAQLDTWAKDIPRQELVVVGGKFDDEKVGDSWSTDVVANSCADDRGHLNCKEAVLLLRGIDRANALGADWLMVGQEDKYLWTETVQRALASMDASKPQVLGSWGCGQGWQYHKEAQNGTLPKPQGWVEPRMSCKAVYEGGGLCGGPTYYVSRAALNLLKQEGQTSDQFVAEYLAGATGDAGASDLFSSCMFYARNIPQARMPGAFAPLNGPSAVEETMSKKRNGLLAAHLDGNKAKIPELIHRLAEW